jgi:hypothetical protein
MLADDVQDELFFWASAPRVVDMSRKAVISTNDILWPVAQLLDTVQKLKELPDVVRNLEKRLIAL